MDRYVLKNNQCFLLVEAPGGVYSTDALTALCKVADDHSAFLKITEDQRIGFMAPVEEADAVVERLQSLGLLIKNYKNDKGVITKSCLGELCPHAEGDALGDALDFSTEHSGKFAGSQVSLGFNGCYRSCASTSMDDLHIVAEPSGYKISLGGKNSEIPQLAQFCIDNVSKKKLPLVLSAILEKFYEIQEGSESLYEVVERVGISPFIETSEALVAEGAATESQVLDTGDMDSVSLEPANFDDGTLSEQDVAEEDFGAHEDLNSEELNSEEPNSDDLNSEDKLEDPQALEFESMDPDSLEAESFDTESLDSEAPGEESPDSELGAEESSESLEIDVDTGSEVSTLSANQTEKMKELMAEDESSSELSEANDEDLARVTSALRDEVSEEPSPSQKAAASEEIDDIDKELADFYPETKQSKTSVLRTLNSTGKPKPAAALQSMPSAQPNKGRSIKVTFFHNQLSVNLPNGMEVSLDLQALDGLQGEPLQFDSDAGPVSVVLDGQNACVRFAGAIFKIPLPDRADRVA